MRFARSRAGALALAVLCVSSACDGGNGRGDAGDGGDAPTDVVAASCSWQPSAPVLTLPRSEVRGTLRGTSRNPSTTCTRSKGAGGPEAIYTLRLTERTVVDLEVVSNIDTVVSIRRDCTDPLTELACNDTSADNDPSGAGGSSGTGGSGGSFPGVPVPPPPFPFDAGADVPQGSNNSRDGHVRAALDPGTYFVLVDEAEAFGVGGDYVLKVSSSTPPAQSSCATALPISDGVSLAAEQLDLASGNAISCSGGTARPALFYKATIPSGQRLTARAFVTRGDRNWTPVIQLLDGCAQTATCLATDRLSSDGSPVLRYVNNGPSDQTVLLAVGANGPVSGGVFRLSVSIGEPVLNQTCASARVLTDGLVLRNQDLSEGLMNTNQRCMSSTGSPSLFYKATLLQAQTLEVALQGQADPRFGGVAPLVMVVSDGCGSFSCEQFGPGSRLVRTNPGPGTRDVIIEVTSFGGFPGSIGLMFDLTAKLSLPPGGVQVSPIGGLQTTEAGGTASFNVVLIAPPLQPVDIPLRSTDPGEGTVKPTSLRFDGSNWSQPQVVTVTGVDDSERDGVQSYTVVVEKATSADSRYAGVDGDDVQVTNRDDEPGFALDQTRPAVTSESGGVASIAVSLNRAPTATVRLPVASSDTSEGRVQAAELVFEPANWGVAQFIRITGVDDSEMDGNQMYQLQLGPAASADPAYNGIDPPDLAVLNTDNEYQKVAAQAVSGRLECLFGRSHIGADQGGRLYVAMNCVDPIPGSGGSGPVDASPATPGMVVPIFPSRDAGSPDLRPGQLGGPAAFVTTSADGGRTFSVPVNTGWQLREMRIAGTTSENAVLAMLGGPVETMVLRTTDAGATWQPPSMLGSGFGDLVLATGGQTVVVAFDSGNGPAVWVSIDGGRTFNRRIIPELRTTRAAHVDPTSGAITLVGFDGVLHVRRSTDNGVTFGQEMTAPASFLATDSVALGPRSLFAMDKNTTLMVAPLDNLSARRAVTGLGPMGPFPPIVMADSADNAVVLETTMVVVLRRLASGQTSFEAGKPFIFSEDMPAGVALSDRAVAVVGRQGSKVMAAVEVWP